MWCISKLYLLIFEVSLFLVETFSIDYDLDELAPRIRTESADYSNMILTQAGFRCPTGRNKKQKRQCVRVIIL